MLDLQSPDATSERCRNLIRFGSREGNFIVNRRCPREWKIWMTMAALMVWNARNAENVGECVEVEISVQLKIFAQINHQVFELLHFGDGNYHRTKLRPGDIVEEVEHVGIGEHRVEEHVDLYDKSSLQIVKVYLKLSQPCTPNPSCPSWCRERRRVPDQQLDRSMATPESPMIPDLNSVIARELSRANTKQRKRRGTSYFFLEQKLPTEQWWRRSLALSSVVLSKNAFIRVAWKIKILRAHKVKQFDDKIER